MVRISEIQQLSEFPKTLQGNFRVWGEYLESSQSNDICREPCMALVGGLPNTRSCRLLFSWHMVCIVLQPHSEQFVVNQLSFISVPRIYNIIIFYYIDTSVILENIPLVKFIKTTSRTRVVYFHNLTREFIDDFIDIKFGSKIVLKFVGVSTKHLRVFLESLRISSDIFGNSRKMFGNVRLAFGTILENLRKSSESSRKSSENHQKRRHQHVYIIKRTLHGGLKI